MFRLSRLLRQVDKRTAGRTSNTPMKQLAAPVVIWNLTKACNLSCLHCYSSSYAGKFEGELSHDDAIRVVDDLKAANVKHLILSGGEPLLRPDLPDIARHAAQSGMSVTLSTNGVLINESSAKTIVEAGFDYIGISIDGSRKIHDLFRGATGAFDKSVRAIKLLRDSGVKTGIRFTVTDFNFDTVPDVISLAEELKVDKLYLSHLVYSGRGDENRGKDVTHEQTRRLMENVFTKAQEYVTNSADMEIVTGNNDTDRAFLLLWLQEKDPAKADWLHERMKITGGNSAGIGVANIDSQGVVHPDPLIQYVDLGNVKDAPFGDIWNSTKNEFLNELRKRPRTIKGRCGECRFLNVCGGNNRERALRIAGDFWASDPACYLTDKEIGIEIAQTA